MGPIYIHSNQSELLPIKTDQQTQLSEMLQPLNYPSVSQATQHTFRNLNAKNTVNLAIMRENIEELKLHQSNLENGKGIIILSLVALALIIGSVAIGILSLNVLTVSGSLIFVAGAYISFKKLKEAENDIPILKDMIHNKFAPKLRKFCNTQAAVLHAQLEARIQNSNQEMDKTALRELEELTAYYTQPFKN